MDFLTSWGGCGGLVPQDHSEGTEVGKGEESGVYPPPCLYPNHELSCPFPLENLPLPFPICHCFGRGGAAKVEKEGKRQEKIWKRH